MLAWTRRRVSSEIGRLPLSTYETVLIDTPACDATSAIVAIAENHTCHVEALRLVCPIRGESARPFSERPPRRKTSQWEETRWAEWPGRNSADRCSAVERSSPRRPRRERASR